MSEARACLHCGVMLPEPVSACPACGAKGNLHGHIAKQVIKVLGAILVVAVGVLALVIWMSRPNPLFSTVHVVPNGHRPSASGLGTDCSGSIINTGTKPVDVWVQLHGIDYADKEFLSERIGPFRNIPPGGAQAYTHHFDATPFKRIEPQVTYVEESDPNATP